jgi:hypothetical protein
VWEPSPGVKILNWELDFNVVPDAHELVVLGTENAFGDYAPLINGPLFLIAYPEDSVLELIFDSFLLRSDFVTAVDMVASRRSFGQGENDLVLTPAAAVPIPAAGYLLGGGLGVLVAIRRRNPKTMGTGNAV